MAAEYGFEYELVEYKWPRWLHQQTEKQRIIWGYKILFLDVLFPLDVKKIIFVDADQVCSQICKIVLVLFSIVYNLRTPKSKWITRIQDTIPLRDMITV
jgi:hypothetical protein